MKKVNLGFTLIELLLTLTIASILLSQALPSFEDFLDKRKVNSNLERLVQTLQVSRTIAISENLLVTVCPTADGNICSSDWSEGYLSFKDSNGNRQFDANEEKIFQFISQDDKNSLSWRAFGVRKSLQWLETGITNHQNGSFDLCYGDKPKLARGLFITKAGRIRYSKDQDGDGIHENATGSPINC